MPIYEYRCRACDEVTEFVLPIEHNAGKLACPKCGDMPLLKCLSIPAGISKNSRESGQTCCGRSERCEAPPCSSGEPCRKG